MHIAIAGNIGAGKTTLTNSLAKHYNFEVQLEDVVDNPYLDDFYNEMERWSFNLQVYFLLIFQYDPIANCPEPFLLYYISTLG